MSTGRKPKVTQAKDHKEGTPPPSSDIKVEMDVAAAPSAATSLPVPPPSSNIPKPQSSAVQPAPAEKKLNLNHDAVLLGTGFLQFYIDKVEDAERAAARETKRHEDEAKKAAETKKTETSWLSTIASSTVKLVTTAVDTAATAFHSGKNYVAAATGHVHEQQNYQLCKLYVKQLGAVNADDKATKLFSLQLEIIEQLDHILKNSLNWNYSTVFEVLFAVVDLINRLPTLFPEDPAVKEYVNDKKNKTDALLLEQTKYNNESLALSDSNKDSTKVDADLYAICRQLRYWGHDRWYTQTCQLPLIFPDKLFERPAANNSAITPTAQNTKAKVAHRNFLEIFLFEHGVKATNELTLPTFLQKIKTRIADEKAAKAAAEAKRIEDEKNAQNPPKPSAGLSATLPSGGSTGALAPHITITEDHFADNGSGSAAAKPGDALPNNITPPSTAPRRTRSPSPR